MSSEVEWVDEDARMRWAGISWPVPRDIYEQRSTPRSVAMIRYYTACVRLACGADGEGRNDYMDTVRMHERALGKSVEQWNIEELEHATKSVERRYR